MRVLPVVLLVGVLLLFGLGMWGFAAASRDSGIPWDGHGAAMKIYRHAFSEMRGSRPMWALVIGFGGVFASALLVALLVVVFDAGG